MEKLAIDLQPLSSAKPAGFLPGWDEGDPEGADEREVVSAE